MGTVGDQPPALGEGTDVNPRGRCDRCKCAPHPDRKCPNRHCGCLEHRDEAGAIAPVFGALVACLLLLAALTGAALLGEHLRCQRLTDAHSPLTSTYCNGASK